MTMQASSLRPKHRLLAALGTTVLAAAFTAAIGVPACDRNRRSRLGCPRCRTGPGAEQGRPRRHPRRHAARPHAARRLARSARSTPISPRTTWSSATSRPPATRSRPGTAPRTSARRDEWLTTCPGGRDLRLLRVQRIVQGRSRARQVQGRPGRSSSRTARKQNYSGKAPAADGAVLADRRSRSTATRTSPTSGRTTPTSRSTPPPWPRSPRPTACRSSTCSTPSKGLFAQAAHETAVADDQRHAPDRGGRPPPGPGDVPRLVQAQRHPDGDLEKLAGGHQRQERRVALPATAPWTATTSTAGGRHLAVPRPQRPARRSPTTRSCRRR